VLEVASGLDRVLRGVVSGVVLVVGSAGVVGVGSVDSAGAVVSSLGASAVGCWSLMVLSGAAASLFLSLAEVWTCWPICVNNGCVRVPNTVVTEFLIALAVLSGALYNVVVGC
jgi:hypothetical protein